MSSNLKLAFVIEAIDNATRKVRAVNEAVAKSREPYTKLRASARDLFQEAGWGKLLTQMQTMRERGAAVAGTLRSIALGAGAVAAAGLAGFAAIKRVADAVDQVNDTAQQLGMTTQLFQRLAYAAQLSGSNGEDMAQSLVFLNKNMGEARGGSKEMLQMFARVGITMADLRNPAFNAGAAIERIADTYQRVGDAGNNAGKKIEVSTALMGRSSYRMNQLLNGGSAAIRALGDEAQRTGAVLSDETVKNMAAFNDSFDRLRATVLGVIANALGPMMPRLQGIVEGLVKWTAANRGLIATRVEEFFKRAAEVLPRVWNFASKLGSVLWDLASATDKVAQAMGDWQNALTVIVALIGTKLVLDILLFAQSLVVLLPAIKAGAGLIGLMVAGLAGSTVGLAVLVGALVGAGALIIANWRPVAEFFSGLWDQITKVASAVGGWLGIGGGPSAPAVIAPVPSAIAAGGNGQLGNGTLKIYFDEAGKPRVSELKKQPGGLIDFDVYAGPTMVTP